MRDVSRINAHNIGLLVGSSNGGTITNCHSTGSIKINGNARNVGGLVGSAENTQISGCTSDVEIEIGGDGENVGGLVGKHNVSVETLLVEINELAIKTNLIAGELTQVTNGVAALRAEFDKPKPQKSILDKIMGTLCNTFISAGAKVAFEELWKHYDKLLMLLQIT